MTNRISLSLSEEQSSVSREIIDDDFSTEKSNDSTTWESVDKKTLSSILVRIAALENENKILKAKANKEAMVSGDKNVISSKNFVSKDTQKKARNRIIAKKLSKKQQELILEQSSFEQKSDDSEVYFKCNSYFITFLIYIYYISQGWL